MGSNKKAKALSNGSIYFLSFIIAIGLSGCHDNVIYFDLKRQAVSTCDGVVIQTLYVKNAEHHIYYTFSLQAHRRGTASFSLTNMNGDYELITSSADGPVIQFKLLPGIEYEITNSSNGDAASGKLLVKMGANGLIEYADKTNCPD